MTLILASNSPRRKQLLGVLGLEFTVLPAEIDESILPGEQPQAYVLRLAQEKAQAVAGLAAPGALVLAADTTVADGEPGAEAILAKPAGPQEATEMLRRLRGHTHQVYTALALLGASSGELSVDLCASGVTMRDYSDAEIEAYVASGDPFDKAGAYAIQHSGFHPAARLDGCYSNVMGLPLCRVAALAAAAGQPLAETLPYPCLYTQTGACSFLPETLDEA